MNGEGAPGSSRNFKGGSNSRRKPVAAKDRARHGMLMLRMMLSAYLVDGLREYIPHIYNHIFNNAPYCGTEVAKFDALEVEDVNMLVDCVLGG